MSVRADKGDAGKVVAAELLRAASAFEERKLRLKIWGPALVARIKAARRHHGWGQRELARRANLSSSQISSVETYGNGLHWDLLASIVYATGANGHWMLTGEGESGLVGESAPAFEDDDPKELPERTRRQFERMKPNGNVVAPATAKTLTKERTRPRT